MQATPTSPALSRATFPLHVAAPAAPADTLPVSGRSRWWLLPWLGLFVWHGWLTLTLFGTDQPWLRLLDDQPLMSGRHPLHLYHSSLGARTFKHNGDLSCYDPHFQAGYPKTPVFDSGSRPGELFLVLARGQHTARAYKIGVAACCLLVPLVLLITVQCLGWSRRTVCLATLLGLLIWWGEPCQRLLLDGDIDILLAALMLVTQIGLLIRFDQRPGLLIWLGICLTGFVGWFAHPVCVALVLPLFLLYYLRVGPRHELLWHLSLLSGLAVAVACNVFWLTDWVRYWWLRAPPIAGDWLLVHRTPGTVWHSSLWGTAVDRGATVGLLLLALGGACCCQRRGEQATVRLLGLGAVILFALTLGGMMHELLGRLQTTLLLLPALLLAVPLAANALDSGWTRLTHGYGFWWSGLLLSAVVPLLYLLMEACPEVLTRSQAARPLEQGLDDSQQQIVAALQKHTTPEGRILWEEVTGAASWSALLPALTERSYIGGIDPTNCIEHSACQLREQGLAGRPLTEWSDDELEDYCRRYNVGWVVVWSPTATARFQRWPLATATCSLPGARPGTLFTIRRPLSYLLKGKARTFKADVGTVTLSDVVPENGEIVLCLHHQATVTASPSRVRVERELDSQDPIPLIRLRVDGPVARITLTFTD